MKFNRYRRKGLSEMVKWSSKMKELNTLKKLIEAGISVSQADIDNGSPRAGDMIARNPDNHEDKWLVAKEYFDMNFVKF